MLFFLLDCVISPAKSSSAYNRQALGHISSLHSIKNKLVLDNAEIKKRRFRLSGSQTNARFTSRNPAPLNPTPPPNPIAILFSSLTYFLGPHQPLWLGPLNRLIPYKRLSRATCLMERETSSRDFGLFVICREGGFHLIGEGLSLEFQ